MRIDIAPQTLPDAIAELSRKARVSIGTDGALPRVRTRRVRGDMPVADALAQLLAGTGYRARQVGPTAWRIERATVPAAPPTLPFRPAPPPRPDPPIIVSATKQSLELMSLPVRVSVTRLDQAERRDPASATATVAGGIGGLSLTSLGPGRNRMFLGGVADSAFSGESQSTVAVVLGEARVTYAAPDPDIRLVDMAQVEVLKGPQGSLYGTGALGGVFHLIPNVPDLSGASGWISGGGNTRPRNGSGWSLAGMANLPLLTDTLAARITGYSQREPGWIDTGTRASSNDTRVTGGRVMLGFEPVSGWRADLTGFAQWLETRDSRYVYEKGGRTRPAQFAEPHDNDLRHAAGSLKGRIGGIALTASSAITWHEVNDTLDATIGAGGLGMDTPRRFTDERQYRVWDNELRLAGHLRGVDWLLGLSYLEANQHILSQLHGDAPRALLIDDDRRTSRDAAIYFNLGLPLTGTLKAEAGARAFLSSIRESREFAGDDISRERDKAGITPGIALSWQPSAERLIYLRYGSAFRQGGSDIGSNGKLDVLDGDELSAIEAGWRESLPGGGSLDVNAALSWWSDIQSDLLLDNGLLETANVGNGRIVDIDAAFDIPLRRDWKLELGANFTEALLVRSATGLAVSDRHLPVVPKYVLRASLRRDFRLGETALWLRIGGRFVGPSHMSFDPDVDRKMGNVLETMAEFHASTGPWDMALSASSLVVNDGNTFAYGNPFRYRTMRQYTPQEPIVIRLSASLAL